MSENLPRSSVYPRAAGSPGPLRRSERPGSRLEVILTRLLGAVAMAIVLAYVGGLLHLLLRGGSKIATFSSNPVPRAGVDGETAMRVLVGIGVFGVLAWAAVSVARPLLARARPPGKANPRLERGLKLGGMAVALVCGFVFRDHVPAFLVMLPSETTAGGGVGPEIFNTLYFAVLSTAVTIPIGVGAAVYMARFSTSRPMVATLRTALDTLASLPSIVYGLFGFLVFVVQMKAGYSLFAGAFVLSLLNLPLVVGISEESIRAVPRELEDASIALGATRVQTTLRVTLPYAWPGVLSALVLAVGRVFAESAPLIMTAGTTISRTNAYSLDPFRGGETLAVHLWYVNSAGLSPDKADVSAGTAAVLVALIFVTNLVASRLARFGGASGGRLSRATR